MITDRCRQKDGFTLIELLVVISIIAIVAAILFPVFAKVREKARQIVCVSNEKQIGLALLAYTEDYDEIMPLRSPTADTYSWKNEVLPYVKSFDVFKCPSNPVGGAPDYNYADGPQPHVGPTFPASFAANRGGGSDGPFVDEPLPAGVPPLTSRDATSVVTLNQIVAPSQVIGIVESTAVLTDYIVTDSRWASEPDASLQLGSLYAGHTGMSNFLFMDGHVKAMKPLATLDAADGGSGSINMWTNNNIAFVTETPGLVVGQFTGQTNLSFAQDQYK